MGAMKDIEVEALHIWNELKADGHALADRARSLYERLHDVAAAAVAEVKGDAEQVVHDTKDAAAPLVAEVKRDAEQVAEHAHSAVVPPPRTPA